MNQLVCENFEHILGKKKKKNLPKFICLANKVLMPNFANPYPKAHEKESPMKSKTQRPTKKIEEQEMSKERSARESNLQQNANLQQNTDLPQNTILQQNDFDK